MRHEANGGCVPCKGMCGLRPFQGSRRILRRQKHFYQTNAYIKGHRLNRGLSALQTRYGQVEYSDLVGEESLSRVMTRQRLHERPLSLRHNSGSLRVLWAGASESQDKGGFIQSLEELASTVAIRQDSGHWGLMSESFDKRHPHFHGPTVAYNDTLLLRRVNEMQASGGLDLLIGQMWANFISVQTLEAIRRMGIVVVNISMDDKLPHLWAIRGGRRMGSAGLGNGVDFTLTTSFDATRWFRLLGYPAFFWPLASSQEIFGRDPHAPRNIDVAFVGSNYGFRSELIQRLEQSGVSVARFGPGWPSGSISASETANIFGQSKIVLGTGTVGYSRTVRTLKLRDFDGPMSGALYLTQASKELAGVFTVGKDVLNYDSVSECVEIVSLLLKHPEERIRIASNGYSVVQKSHEWSQRVGQILDTVRDLT